MARQALEIRRTKAAWPGVARVGEVLATMWQALPTAGRFALVGVLMSAIVAVALGVFIPLETRRHVLIANGRGLEAAVMAIQPSLPDLTSGPLSADEVAHLDRLVGRAILDTDHVRAKLWSLDGVVLYSDAGEMVGRSFPDVVAQLGQVAEHGVIAEVSDLTDPENEFEADHRRLVEYYIPVRAEGGRVVGVFEIYQDVWFLEEALAGVTLATWLAIGSGLTVLLIFMVFLVAVAVRSISRDRAAAEARAAELTVLVGAAEALASSLEPSEFLARLDARVRTALGLSRLSRESNPAQEDGRLSLHLRDGSWLVAEPANAPLSDEDARVLRSVANSLDAALANAMLFAEVRDAAQTRRSLLRQVVEAHEDERRHIVGELHDSLAAELIRVLYGIRGVVARGHDLPDEIAREIGDLELLVSRTEEGLRSFMSRVRPVALDEFGLGAGLEVALDRFRCESGLECELRVTGHPERASPALQLVVLRSAEEALLNVRKHAAATRVRVTIRTTAGHLRLAVDDDGLGWLADHDDRDSGDRAGSDGRGLGMTYLLERVAGFGGTVHAERSPLGGARLSISVPLEA
jgi:signal transduction histidine kinase